MLRGIAALMLLPMAALAQEAPVPSGDVRIHDPSVIVADGHWVSFQTGDEGGLYQGAIKLKTSPDGVTWTNAGAIGKGVPKWTEAVLGYRSRNIWAPSAVQHDGTWYLYYSVSSFGINVSTIGLMTNSAFDPLTPSAGWVDQGEVLHSGGRDDFNAIDPYRIDTADGRAWLSYGSYWTGIKLRELDPKSGKLIAADAPVHALASRQGGAIEASSLLEHDGKFYLFVSYDQCCQGVASTYRIMVGRAETVTGPYRDASGTDMLTGAASEVQASAGHVIGPGGQEPVFGAGVDMLAYHYYDGADLGAAKLRIAPLRWTDDGWPELPPP